MVRIEIIAIGHKKVYNVGAIEINRKGDIYFFHKVSNSDFHTSRHSSGITHWKSRKNSVYRKIREGVPIKDFEGIEFLETLAFGLDSLTALFKEYEMKRSNGIFAIDMREYKDASFNMSLAILTEKGLPKLYEVWKKFRKRQIYIYTDSHPMIAITISDLKNQKPTYSGGDIKKNV